MKKASKLTLTLLLLSGVVLCSLPASALEKVAVLDFKSILAPPDLGIAVAEILRTELVGIGEYTVIERGMLEQILREQELQETGVVDSETAVEIGKLVGANLVVIGSIVKTGTVYTINSRFIDVETSIAKVGQNIRGQGEDQISDMVHQLALIIAGKTVTEEVVAGQSSPQTGETYLFSFEERDEIAQWQPTNDDQNIHLKRSGNHPTEGKYTLKVRLPKSSPDNAYPGIYTRGFLQNWSPYTQFAFDLYFEPVKKSPKPPILLAVRIDDNHSTSYENRFHLEDILLKPGENSIHIAVKKIGEILDINAITAVYIFLGEPEERTTLYFDHIRLK